MTSYAVPAAVNATGGGCSPVSSPSPPVATGPQSIRFTVPGKPVPWARAAGGTSRKRFTPAKQRAAMEAIKLMGVAVMGWRGPLQGPLYFSVMAIYPWPTSWTMKQCMQPGARWKTSRPDIDNLAKLCADSLNGICWNDDAQICCVAANKRYGQNPGIEIEIRQLT